MIKVIRQAVKDRERPLGKDARIPFGAFTLTLHVDESAEVVARGQASSRHAQRAAAPGGAAGVPPSARGARSRRRTVAPQPRRSRSAGQPALLGEGEDAIVEADHAESVREAAAAEETERRARLSRVPELVAALDRMWPVLPPEELLHDLFGAKALLRLAGRGVLTDEESDLLMRPRSESFEVVPWTSADLALLDELRVHLGRTPRDGSVADGEVRTVRPRHRGRGPGSVADAAACPGAPVPGLDDDRR